MNPQYSISIAYVSDDNQEIINNNKGWISNFQRFMDMMLHQISGENFAVNIVNEKEPKNGLLQSNAVLVVISPDFFDSKEWSDFFDSQQGNHLLVDRLFKVVKSPVERSKQSPVLQNLLDYDLFHTDPITDNTTEVSVFFGPEAEKDFWMRLVDLAYDVFSTVVRTDIASGDETKKTAFMDDAVYLAETGTDLEMHRNLIKRELLRYGFKVLPDHALPNMSTSLEERVKQDLIKSKLSIHMIGNSMGDVLDDTYASVLDVQNRIASEYINHANGKLKFNRLIWLAPNLTIRSEKQRIFIESLKRSAENLNGAEILQTPLEDFKNIIRKKLSHTTMEQNQNSSFTKGKDASKKWVYVLYDQEDKAQAEEVVNYCKSKGFEVLVPKFEGELMDIRGHHIECLRNFDIALVIKEKVNSTWVRMKLFDLLKSPGFGRSKPILGRALLHYEPVELDQSFFTTYDIQLFSVNKDVQSDVLNAFFQSINATV
ncbi:hypothetical protein QWY31_07790 [Cytophagales bacterium LB-30]|uniref:TIR domain-containing protein n=1 Tax=Shiella aurantiaca TaxID=3058365 RepID=A0ABT8F4T2_9BACT|nr:hypothetical protein [Shiella aurantiaca]MDN4165398.1 hypothetical protein [Shiella aurantiaca]